MIKKFSGSLLDGLVSALLIFILGKYSISSLVSFESLFGEIIVITTCIFISAISAIYNLKYISVREMLMGYLISFISNIIFLCIIFSLNTLSDYFRIIEILPARGLSNADGLYIILFEGVYLVGGVFVRIVIFFIQLMKILKRKKLAKVSGIS